MDLHRHWFDGLILLGLALALVRFWGTKAAVPEAGSETSQADIDQAKSMATRALWLMAGVLLLAFLRLALASFASPFAGINTFPSIEDWLGDWQTSWATFIRYWEPNLLAIFNLAAIAVQVVWLVSAFMLALESVFVEKGRRSLWHKTLRISKLTGTHITLIVLSIVFILPFLWMLSTSLKPLTETMTKTPQWIPHHIVWKNYSDAFTYNSKSLGYIPFLYYARNTIILCWLCVVGTVLSCALVAYSFARLKWKGRELFFAITLATMMIPFPVLMVPLYALFKEFGWIGSFRPLWIPAFFGSAFNIFLLRQFFRTIPFELSEAAKIDGASEWRIFADVILPLAKPALAVVALFTFMGTWNDFLGPLIYLLDQKTFTLSLGLQAYQSQNGGTVWNLLMAATTIVILPVVILFFFTQRVFIRGIALTGLKG